MWHPSLRETFTVCCWWHVYPRWLERCASWYPWYEFLILHPLVVFSQVQFASINHDRNHVRTTRPVSQIWYAQDMIFLLSSICSFSKILFMIIGKELEINNLTDYLHHCWDSIRKIDFNRFSFHLSTISSTFFLVEQSILFFLDSSSSFSVLNIWNLLHNVQGIWLACIKDKMQFGISELSISREIYNPKNVSFVFPFYLL